MQRRNFLSLTGGALTAGVMAPLLASCGSSWSQPLDDSVLDDPPPPVEPIDPDATVVRHDTYAQALYFDGGYGPKTGIVTTAMMAAGAKTTLEFWHGHGGEKHEYVISSEDFMRLKQGERITIETDEVAGHSHKLFIDPVAEEWRVPDAEDVEIPLAHQNPEPPEEDETPDSPSPIDPESEN